LLVPLRAPLRARAALHRELVRLRVLDSLLLERALLLALGSLRRLLLLRRRPLAWA
jgi:hypothetical protein